jgi:hypothetical protein
VLAIATPQGNMHKQQSHEVKKKLSDPLEPASAPTKATAVEMTNSRPPQGDATKLLFSFDAQDFTQVAMP